MLVKTQELINLVIAKGGPVLPVIPKTFMKLKLAKFSPDFI